MILSIFILIFNITVVTTRKYKVKQSNANIYNIHDNSHVKSKKNEKN
jgi:hypothetical protein